jgi:tyrosinase
MANGQASAPRPSARIRLRRSASRLTPEQLELLRDAFRGAMEISDERGYNYFAGIHGLPRPIGCDNAHGTYYFLPWHRAYLYFFERALRDRVPDAMLVWWDWRTQTLGENPGIPRAFSQKRPGGRRNPLYSAAVDPLALEQGRQARPPVVVEPNTVRELGPPGAPPLPTVQEVRAVLRLDDFRDFSDTLEDIHGRVHVWTGGRNGHMRHIPFAAFDPIFWAHHTMIDRLWRLWQLRHPNANPPASIMDDALPPFRMTVRRTLDVTALGYDYAASTSSQPVAPR